MIYNVHSFLFFIISMVCFHHTLAYERWINALVIPSRDILRSCDGWVKYYGFGDDVIDNRTKALARRREHDKNVHVWTVSYASYLATIVNSLTPYGAFAYCEVYLSQNSEVVQYYKPLKDSTMSCKDWIFFNGYNYMSESTRIQSIQLRNIVEDNFNSIWTTSYVRFIHRDDRRASTTPEDFCIAIGKNDPQQENYYMSYMNINYTLLTCEEWIKLNGFTDNVPANLQKLANQSSEYDETMNMWAKSYTKFLRNFENSEDVVILQTPFDHCKTLGYNIEALPFEPRVLE